MERSIPQGHGRDGRPQLPELLATTLSNAGPASSAGTGLTGATRADSSRPRVSAVVAALGAGLVALGLGLAAVQPGVGFWDTAEFQTVGPVLGTAHPTGFPAYVLLGWIASIVLQPLGEPAWRMNVLSSVLVATAVSMLVLLVWLLVRRPWLGLAAGAVLATTPIVWSLATRADPHPLLLAAASVVLVLLVAWERAVGRAGQAPWRFADRLLVAVAVAYGVALAAHSLALLLAPGIGLFVLAVEPSIRRRPRAVARPALALVLTVAILYLELPVRALMHAPLVYGHPDTVIGFLGVALGAQFSGSFAHPLTLAANLAGTVNVAVAQLGPLAPLVPFAAWATAVRLPRFGLLSIPTVLLMTVFAASYTNADIGRYYAIPLLLVTAWIAVLAAVLVDRALAAIARIAPRRPPRWIPELAAAALVVLPAASAVPARFDAVDRATNTDAARWLDAVLQALPPRAVVVSWWDYSTTLWYGQLVEGRRGDISIVDDRTRLDQGLGDVSDVIASQLGRRPVFLIRLADEMPALAARYSLRPVPTLPGSDPLQEVVGSIAEPRP